MTDATDRLSLRSEFITLAQAVKAVELADSGGQAKARVRSGDIRVNGAVDTAPGRKLRAGDRFGTGEREWTISA